MASMISIIRAARKDTSYSLSEAALKFLMDFFFAANKEWTRPTLVTIFVGQLKLYASVPRLGRRCIGSRNAIAEGPQTMRHLQIFEDQGALEADASHPGEPRTRLHREIQVFPTEHIQTLRKDCHASGCDDECSFCVFVLIRMEGS